MKTNTAISRHHAGPPLLSLAVVHTLLFVISVAALRLLAHPAAGSQVLNPYGPPEAARTFFAANPRALQVSAFFLFGSAVPLAIYAATVLSQLRFLGVRAAGTYIAFTGGLAASFGIAASGLCSWALSIPEATTSAAMTRVLHFMTYLCGGPAFAAGFGLLAAGVSITSFFGRLLPRWLVWFGMLIAVAGELSTLGLIWLPMTVAIPVTRFGGFVWLIAVGVALPKRLTEQNS
ncbi:MAG TPA: hypothetical protein VFE38_06595 [Edaphobacter sp.]|nr:hypothetical protein [Edaphobacter sp.]